MMIRNAYLVAVVLALNVLDAASTQVGVSMGVLREVNPLMLAAFAFGPAAFWGAKFLLTTLGLVMLWRVTETRQRFRFSLVVIVAAYMVVLATHIIGWSNYLLGAAQ